MMRVRAAGGGPRVPRGATARGAAVAGSWQGLCGR